MVEIILPAALEDPACVVLEELGSVGWESRACEPGVSSLLAYWADPAPPGLGEAILRRLDRLAESLAVGGPKVGPVSPLPEEDWEANWRRHFRIERPIPGLVIHPSWIPYEAGPGETVIEIDPKMAFGVGSHPTTRLCLRLLHACSEADRLLDVGTGTGILAIAAARWGAVRVVGVEIDRAAVVNAVENVSRNGVRGVLRIIHGGADAVKGPFDRVVANLLTTEFRSALPDIVRVLRPGGRFVLSGFLVSEERAVREVLQRHGLAVESAEREGEWGALRARARHAAPAGR